MAPTPTGLWEVSVSSDYAIILAIVALYTAGLCSLLWPGVCKAWRNRRFRIPPVGRVLLLIMALSAVAVGGDKSPAMKALASLITALRNGLLLDPSGRVGSAAYAKASQTVADMAGDIIGAASQTVAQAQAQFDSIAGVLTNRGTTVAYIAADLPRAWAGAYTNHNLSASIQRTRQVGNTNLVAYVWFSEKPTINPQVAMSYSAEDGVWADMEPVTNSYPATVDVDGVPCVEYVYAIPELYRGIVFRPEYELQFGGAGDEECLAVPAGGIVVQSGNDTLLPFTGTDVYSGNFSVTYKGGVAVSACFHGTNYTGFVEGEVIL